MQTPDAAATNPTELLARMQSLQRIALAVVRPTGPSESAFLHELLAEVIAALPADGALVAVFDDAEHMRLRTLAVRLDGEALPDFVYPVQGSPCQRVVGRGLSPVFRYSACGVMAEVDPASHFAVAKLDAYAAFPLMDAGGEPVGVLAALGRNPIAGGDAEHAQLVLNVAAGRLAGELERRQAMNLLRHTALAVSAARGETIFDELARMLAASLEVEFAFIARHTRADPDHLTMVALFGDGRVVNGLRYAIAPTPCSTVLGQQFRAYPSDLASHFPDDPDVLGKGAESYAGLPLAGIGGEPLGVIAVGSRRPLRDVAQIEAMLKIFAARAAAELERLDALEALRRSEASYRAIFDSASSAIFVHDWDSFALIDVNRRACEEHGRTRAELLSAPPEDLMAGVAPYSLEQALERLQQARLGRCPPFEWQVRIGDGGIRWWEIHLKPAQLDGRPCILAFTHDITARKAAEQLVRASEEQHRTIFNASVDGMLVKDADNRVVDVNESYLRMHGFSREELIGSCLLDRLPAALRAQCQLLLPGVMTGTPCHFEAQTQRLDGSLLDVEIHGVRVVYGGQARALVVMRDITERKRTEGHLRASEAQYRAMFDASDDALMLWDHHLRRVDVNPAHQRIFGYEREEVVGRAFEGLDWPEDLVQQRIDMLQRALAGEASRAEVEAVRRDGRRIVTELRTIPFVHRGEPHLLQIARDITEQRRREVALRQSEAQYRAIFNSSADAIFLWDADLRFVDMNRAFTQMYGYEREEVIGTTLEGRLPPAAVAEREAAMRAALAGEERVLETTTLRKNGESFDVELRYFPILHQGKPHVLAIARDFSERRKAEAALRAREQLHRALFDTSVDAMVLFDGSKRLVDVNTAFEKLRGMAREDLIGRPWPRHNDVPGQSVAEPLIESALAGQEATAVTTVLHVTEGRHVDLELRYLPVRLDGEPFALGIGRNVSERLRLESQLRQAQKMEAIGQLTGGIAHDFNNILTSVLGYVAMAEERAAAGADPRLERQLGQARLATERARDLVAQMLAFAQRRGGKRQPLDVAQMVRETVALLRSTMPSSVLLETGGLDKALPMVDGDVVQLGQVLMNLAINARDAVEGRGRVRVTVRTRDAVTGALCRCSSCGNTVAAGRWLGIEVEDNGCGIATDVLQRMFDPFFSTKPAGQGTGMGLAMVHGIVHDHGGHVEVSTRPGQGSRFTVLLPVRANGLEAPPAPGQPGTAAKRPSGPRLSGTVLVVEDDVQAGEFLHDRLGAWGLDVVLKRDPREALAWLGREDAVVDLLVTDLTMPHLSGMQLASQATAQRPGLPVMLISGDLRQADAAARKAAGIRYSLAKPLDAAVLRDAIAQALQH